MNNIYQIVYLNSLTEELKEVIRREHYLGKPAPGCKHIFALYDTLQDKLVGVCQVGICVSANAYKSYSYSKEELLEVRRFCLVRGASRPNLCSWFLSQIIKYFKTNHPEVKALISYADQNQGHEGTIYKAANFSYIKETKKLEQIEYLGKLYHLRTVYDKNRHLEGGRGLQVRNALTLGLAKRVYSLPKHVYMYEVRKKCA